MPSIVAKLKQLCYQRHFLSVRITWSVSIVSLLLLILSGLAAYRIALEESQAIIDRQMHEMADFFDKNNLSARLSHFDPNFAYDETDVFIDIVPLQALDALRKQHDYLLPLLDQPQFLKRKTSRGELKIYVLPLRDKQIQISQPISVRQHLAEQLALNMLIPYLLFMPFGIYGLYRLIRYYLRGIAALSESFAKRDYHDLSEITIQDLPIELSPAINELNYLFKRIDQARQQQQLFIASAAHELRTPLTALNLQCSLLAKTPRGTPSYQENLADLKTSLKRMSHLVEQLMALAQQELLINEPLQPCNLVEFTRRCVAQLLMHAHEKKIELIVDIEDQQEEILIAASRLALDSILLNLIDNAIKYSPNQGMVWINLYRQQHYSVLEIHDSGQGIAAEHYAHVLQRFVRLKATQQQTLGSGLGLSIVQSALQAIDAQMDLASSEHLGGLKVVLHFR